MKTNKKILATPTKESLAFDAMFAKTEREELAHQNANRCTCSACTSHPDTCKKASDVAYDQGRMAFLADCVESDNPYCQYDAPRLHIDWSVGFADEKHADSVISY